MELMDKFVDFFKSIDTSDEETDRFIDEKYNGLLQICLLVTKLDRRNLFKSCTQYVLYFSLILYHFMFAIKGLIVTKGINFVLYSKGAYYFMFIQMTLIGIVTLTMNRSAIVQFHRNMSKNFYDYKEKDADFVVRLRDETEKETKLFALVPISTVAGAVVGFVIAPLLDKYGTYVVEDVPDYLNVNLPAPIIAYTFSTFTHLGFIVAYIIQVCTGSIVLFIIGGGGYLYIEMTQSVRCQIRILITSLEKIEERADNYYYQISGLKMRYKDHQKFSDELYDFCYNECLKKNFKHHQIILSSFDCLGKYFSIPVFMAYLTGSVVIALSLLSNNIWELPGTSMTSMVLGCIEVGYMAFISYLGQTIIDLNDELRVKMYETRWYYGSNRTKISIKIFQQMTLKPLETMTASIVPINLDTFSVVMNSAYSYYNLINAFS